jgi:hypothetical protein
VMTDKVSLGVLEVRRLLLLPFFAVSLLSIDTPQRVVAVAVAVTAALPYIVYDAWCLRRNEVWSLVRLTICSFRLCSILSIWPRIQWTLVAPRKLQLLIERNAVQSVS